MEATTTRLRWRGLESTEQKIAMRKVRERVQGQQNVLECFLQILSQTWAHVSLGREGVWGGDISPPESLLNKGIITQGGHPGATHQPKLQSFVEKFAFNYTKVQKKIFPCR
jgi:hypothetical protein